MSKIKISDLPKDMRVSKREMATVTGGVMLGNGTLGGVYVSSAKLKAHLFVDLRRPQ